LDGPGTGGSIQGGQLAFDAKRAGANLEPVRGAAQEGMLRFGSGSAKSGQKCVPMDQGGRGGM